MIARRIQIDDGEWFWVEVDDDGNELWRQKVNVVQVGPVAVSFDEDEAEPSLEKPSATITLEVEGVTMNALRAQFGLPLEHEEPQ